MGTLTDKELDWMYLALSDQENMNDTRPKTTLEKALAVLKVACREQKRDSKRGKHRDNLREFTIS